MTMIRSRPEGFRLQTELVDVGVGKQGQLLSTIRASLDVCGSTSLLVEGLAGVAGSTACVTAGVARTVVFGDVGVLVVEVAGGALLLDVAVGAAA